MLARQWAAASGDCPRSGACFEASFPDPVRALRRDALFARRSAGPAEIERTGSRVAALTQIKGQGEDDVRWEHGALLPLVGLEQRAVAAWFLRRRADCLGTTRAVARQLFCG